MRHELIIKREDGSKVKIDTELYLPSCKEEFSYNCYIWTKGKGKRKWLSMSFMWNGYEYRRLSTEDRKKYEQNKILEIVSLSEILQAKTELWEKLKPV